MQKSALTYEFFRKASSVLLFSIFLLPFVSAEKVDIDFERIVIDLLKEKTHSFDDIHEKLGPFSRDSVQMRALVSSSQRHNFLLGQSYALAHLGNIYLSYSSHDKSRALHNQALKIATDIENLHLQMICLNMLGVADRRTDQIRSSIDLHQEARAVGLKIENPSRAVMLGIATSENSIGNAYTILQQHEQSMKYYNRALAMEIENDNLLGQAINYQNIGQAHEELGRLDSAYYYYQKSLAANEANNSEYGIIICYNSMAQIHNLKGEYAKAIELLEPCVERIKKINDPFHEIFVLSDLGQAYLGQNNLTKAEKLITEAYDISREKNIEYSLANTYTLLSELEAKKGNYKKALDFNIKSRKQNDKIVNEQNSRYINDLNYKYDNEHLATENEIIKLRLKQNRIFLWISALAAIIMAIATFFYFKMRQKQKDAMINSLKRESQIKTLESLIEGEEKERNRIAKDLHDGLNGQLSAIKYKLSSIADEQDKDLEEVIDMIDDSCEQVRTISHNLIPPSLENFDLIDATEDFCSYMDEAHSPEILFQHMGDSIKIDKQIEVNIYRIIQELVTNSIKHANASEITVQLSKRGELLQVTVEDDGKGFDLKKIASNGIGLKNIQSRVDYLEAHLDFNSNVQGTSYIIEIDTRIKHAS